MSFQYVDPSCLFDALPLTSASPTISAPKPLIGALLVALVIGLLIVLWLQHSKADASEKADKARAYYQR
jgi:hypothetical protein